MYFILGNFLTFHPLNSPKNKNFKKKKRKKTPGHTSFYASTPKIMIICYTVLEIWCVTDVIVIFHFWLVFALLPPNSLKNENFNKMEKYLEISSFYTSVPKIMIICHTIPERWHATYIIVIFHFGLFLPFYSPKNQNQNQKQSKKLKFQKNEKGFWRYHHFTHVYHKLWLDDLRFLRYGARQTDGQTEKVI